MPIIEQHQVYIITNERNTVFYIGLTNNLKRRLWQHKHQLMDGFSKKYNLTKLIYSELLMTTAAARKREKQIKGWTRIKKINLIKLLNPDLEDLSKNWFGFKKKRPLKTGSFPA